MSNISCLEKFWPRWWDVAPWMARPVAGIRASTAADHRNGKELFINPGIKLEDFQDLRFS